MPKTGDARGASVTRERRSAARRGRAGFAPHSIGRASASALNRFMLPMPKLVGKILSNR
jgi:hypothetical protein